MLVNVRERLPGGCIDSTCFGALGMAALDDEVCNVATEQIVDSDRGGIGRVDDHSAAVTDWEPF